MGGRLWLFLFFVLGGGLVLLTGINSAILFKHEFKYQEMVYPFFCNLEIEECVDLCLNKCNLVHHKLLWSFDSFFFFHLFNLDA